MRAYALVELGDSESIDLFLREEDARRALEDALRDEPDWVGGALRGVGSSWTSGTCRRTEEIAWRPSGLTHQSMLRA